MMHITPSIRLLREDEWTYLIPRKLRPQQTSRMRPPRPIKRKNAISQQRIKLLMSRPKTKILKLRREDSLHIFGFNGRKQLPRQKPLGKRRAVNIELITQVINPSLLADRPAQP